MQVTPVIVVDRPAQSARGGSRSNGGGQMSWKAFWSLLGSSLSFASAVIPLLLGIEQWVTIVSVAIGSIFITMAAYKVTRNAKMFIPLRDRQRERVASLTIPVVWAFAIWSALFTIYPHMWVQWFLVLPIIGAAVYWGARWAEYRLSVENSRSKLPAYDLDYGASDISARFRFVLGRAGHPHVKILSHDEVNDDNGVLVANQFLIQTPATGK